MGNSLELLSFSSVRHSSFFLLCRHEIDERHDERRYGQGEEREDEEFPVALKPVQ